MFRFTLLLLVLLPSTVLSYPRYATRSNAKCTLCHVNPAGGGHRNITGKAYGSKGIGFAQTSSQDNYYGNFRSVFYLPEKPKENKNSVALMQASASLKIPIQKDDKGNESLALGSYDFGQLATDPVREVFLLWKNTEQDWTPNNILFGRFYLPFGLISDEHRIYTRMQTNSTMRDFDFGLQMSSDPSQNTHYDLAVTSGFRSGGGRFTEPGDLAYALTGNLRYKPSAWPLMLGASLQHQYTEEFEAKPTALAIYNVTMLDNIFNSLPQIDWVNEITLAENWNGSTFNNYIGMYFIGSNNVLRDRVEFSQSLGVRSELIWQYKPKIQLSYRYEQLTLDRFFPGDRFMRHGFGVNHQFTSNMSALLKVEIADLGRDDLNEDGLLAAQNVLFAQLRYWF